MMTKMTSQSRDIAIATRLAMVKWLRAITMPVRVNGFTYRALGWPNRQRKMVCVWPTRQDHWLTERREMVL